MLLSYARPLAPNLSYATTLKRPLTSAYLSSTPRTRIQQEPRPQQRRLGLWPRPSSRHVLAHGC